MRAARRSVSVWVHADDPPRVLLLRRPEARAAGWQPVTGRVEPTDASLEDACAREIAEETGLPPPEALRDLAIDAQFVGYDGATYRQRSFAAAYARELPIVKSNEHEEIRWATIDEALALLRWEDDKMALRTLAKLLRSETALK